MYHELSKQQFRKLSHTRCSANKHQVMSAYKFSTWLLVQIHPLQLEPTYFEYLQEYISKDEVTVPAPVTETPAGGFSAGKIL